MFSLMTTIETETGENVEVEVEAKLYFNSVTTKLKAIKVRYFKDVANTTDDIQGRSTTAAGYFFVYIFLCNHAGESEKIK